MRIPHIYTTILLANLLAVSSCKQNVNNSFSRERKEIEIFLDDYKLLLQKAKFDSVALLYVDTGFVSLGNGQMDVQNLDSIKAFYSRLPKIENDFRWANTRIDVFSKNAALITSFFYWHNKTDSDTTKQCYTGLLIKSDNKWKIRHEHESLDMETMAKLIKQSEIHAK